MRYQIYKLLIFSMFFWIRLLLWVVNEYGQTGKENIAWHAQISERRITFQLCGAML